MLTSICPNQSFITTGMQHQYIERETGQIRNETLFADRIVNLVYSSAREYAPALFRLAVGRRMSGLLGFFNYDLKIGTLLSGNQGFLNKLGVDTNEFLEPPAALNTARKVFERKIKYWDCRPMDDDPQQVVSPADAKVLFGSLKQQSTLFIKEKFFHFEELLGVDKRQWLYSFAGGDFAVFRLTPEKYHYNHTPVAGRVMDVYEIEGDYHSCNPNIVVSLATPYSKNKRVVTIINTDVPGGSGVGLVAMIEVVALMIGDVVQQYSETKYDSPLSNLASRFLHKGAPKSLFRPGSSTVVLLFQPGRCRFEQDLIDNMYNRHAISRFSLGFGHQLVETEVKVRSAIGKPAQHR